MRLKSVFSLIFPFLLFPSLALAGVTWQTPPLDKHLAQATKTNSLVVVKFDASWCTTCQELKKQVFQSDAGEKAFEGMIPVVVDFDIPENRALIERYVILGLPTVIVLNLDGKQLGRIAGFENPAAWLSEFKEARKGSDPIAKVEAELKKDPTSPKAVLNYGRTLLVNGQIEKGLSFLKRSQSLDDEAIAAEALFLQGRYFHRVKQDSKSAQAIWHQLISTHAQSDYFNTGLWWYARACQELGTPQTAIDNFREHTKTGPIELFGMWQGFLKKYKLPDEGKQFAEAVKARLKTKVSADDRESLELLLKKR